LLRRAVFCPPFFGGHAHKDFIPEAAARPVILPAASFQNEAQLLVYGLRAGVVLEVVEVDLVVSEDRESVGEEQGARFRAVALSRYSRYPMIPNVAERLGRFSSFLSVIVPISVPSVSITSSKKRSVLSNSPAS
jgi:hypothetical protein